MASTAEFKEGVWCGHISCHRTSHCRLRRQAETGRSVALPTETVYGLAGDATNGEAIAAIYATKARPQFNPLICHVADMEAHAP